MLLLTVCKAPAACRKTSGEPDTLESQGSGWGPFTSFLSWTAMRHTPSEERRLCFPLGEHRCPGDWLNRSEQPQLSLHEWAAQRLGERSTPLTKAKGQGGQAEAGPSAAGCRAAGETSTHRACCRAKAPTDVLKGECPLHARQRHGTRRKSVKWTQQNNDNAQPIAHVLCSRPCVWELATMSYLIFPIILQGDLSINPILQIGEGSI